VLGVRWLRPSPRNLQLKLLALRSQGAKCSYDLTGVCEAVVGGGRRPRTDPDELSECVTTLSFNALVP